MLVLSRKLDQKIVFPELDVTIQILRCNDSHVKLGFKAPPRIRILREELESRRSMAYDPEMIGELLGEQIENVPCEFRHQWRNKLNTVAIALNLLNEEIEAGEFSDAEEAYQQLVCMLSKSDATAVESVEDASVLVVEDQANEREMLAGILRMNGYSVVTVGDGVEALEYLEDNEPPAFVLVDIQMPRCDGATVVRQIRESERLSDVRVYVVSGLSEKDCALPSEKVDCWHVKPVNPQHLIATMSTTRMHPEVVPA